MKYSMPYMSKSNYGSSPYCILPVIVNGLDVLKTLVPYIDSIPCLGYQEHSYNGSVTKDWIWHYLHIPYTASNVIRSSNFTFDDTTLAHYSNCIVQIGTSQLFRTYFRPLNIFKWMSDNGYGQGNISGIVYKNGVESQDIGDFVAIPILRRYILITIVYNMTVPDTTWVAYGYANDERLAHSTLMRTRQVFLNGNNYTPSQVVTLLDDYAVWNIVHGGSGYDRSVTPSTGYYTIQGTHIYDTASTDRTFLYLEMPKVESISISRGTQMAPTYGLVDVCDYFISICEYNDPD